MSTWTGLNKKDDTKKEKPDAEPSRQRMNWGFSKAGPKDETPRNDDAEDDRHIRFKIGGAGRRLTKEDFLKEIQSLDPKARCEIVAESSASPAMKALAEKDASQDSPGSSRLFGASKVERASGKGTAKAVGAQMARDRGADLSNEDEEESEDDGNERRGNGQERGHHAMANKNARTRTISNPTPDKDHPSNDVPESKAERRRREQALKGVDEVTPAQRGRGRERETSNHSFNSNGNEVQEESAAERRRREAALGMGGGRRDGGSGSGSGSGEVDSDDDDGTPRVPPPVHANSNARSRGIRFAQSPVRGRN
jgi:hypothetical protein